MKVPASVIVLPYVVSGRLTIEQAVQLEKILNKTTTGIKELYTMVEEQIKLLGGEK